MSYIFLNFPKLTWAIYIHTTPHICPLPMRIYWKKTVVSFICGSTSALRTYVSLQSRQVQTHCPVSLNTLKLDTCVSTVLVDANLLYSVSSSATTHTSILCISSTIASVPRRKGLPRFHSRPVLKGSRLRPLRSATLTLCQVKWSPILLIECYLLFPSPANAWRNILQPSCIPFYRFRFKACSRRIKAYRYPVFVSICWLVKAFGRLSRYAVIAKCSMDNRLAADFKVSLG